MLLLKSILNAKFPSQQQYFSEKVVTVSFVVCYVTMLGVKLDGIFDASPLTWPFYECCHC